MYLGPFSAVPNPLPTFPSTLLGIAANEGADRRPANDDQLERLVEHRQFTAKGHVPAQHTDDDHDPADDDKHARKTRRILVTFSQSGSCGRAVKKAFSLPGWREGEGSDRRGRELLGGSGDANIRTIAPPLGQIVIVR